MRIKQTFLAIFSIFILFFLPSQVKADEIEDLTVLWPAGLSFYNTYDSLPAEVKALLPTPVQWNEYPAPTSPNPYPDYGRQCTWFVYHRAKQNGRTYSTHEGNGGFWHLTDPSSVGAGGAINTTAGDTTPRAQVAASIIGGGNYLGAYGSPGHVIYVEYIDKKGNLLISEGNVRNSIDNGGSGGDKKENLRIIQASDPNFNKLRFVDPSNAKDLKDNGKNPDGSKVGTTPDTKPTEDKEIVATDGEGNPIDDTFTVNGFGTTLGRDWNENDLSQNIPRASDLMQLSSKQRQALADWVAEYNTSMTGTTISFARTLIQGLGLAFIFLSIALVIAYLFDRVGVLDFSLLYALTGGKLYTVYDSQDDTFFSKSSSGKGKGVGIRSLIILILIMLTLVILIFTGKIYEYVYILITLTGDIVEGVLSKI